MNVFLNIKLIARNWWRNKLFFLISLFSLTAGLGCTNLLMTFLSMNIMWKNIIPTVTSFIYYVKTLQWKKVLK